MKAKKVAQIDILINPDSTDASVTAGRPGGGHFVITINKGERPFEVTNMREFRTTLSHELGHVVSLLSFDPSHNPDKNFGTNGRLNMNMPAEETAWKVAHDIYPELDTESERRSLGAYRKAKKAIDSGVPASFFGNIPEPATDAEAFEEPVFGQEAFELSDAAQGLLKLSAEDLAGIAHLMAAKDPSFWHNTPPILPEPEWDDFVGRWDDDGGHVTEWQDYLTTRNMPIGPSSDWYLQPLNEAAKRECKLVSEKAAKDKAWEDARNADPWREKLPTYTTQAQMNWYAANKDNSEYFQQPQPRVQPCIGTWCPNDATTETLNKLYSVSANDTSNLETDSAIPEWLKTALQYTAIAIAVLAGCITTLYVMTRMGGSL
jgi:hypothetical protein